jgi:hypothetical protein
VSVLVPIIVISLLASAIQTGTSPSVAFFSPLTRAWELALGALVAVATPTLLRLHRTLATALTWVGLSAIGYAAVHYSSSTSYPGTAVIVPVVGTALVIAGGSAVPAWGAEAILRVRPFQWVGRLSYSLYLWHWPILIIAAEWAGHNGLPFHQNIGWLALAFAVAYATHKLVENPVRHSRRLARSRWLPIGLGIAMIGVSLSVATIALALNSGPDATSTGSSRVSIFARIPWDSPRELRQLIEAAPLITTLPRDLTPSLTNVRDDWGGPLPPCWPSYAQTSVPACSFGDPHGTHTAVLYGDSHAAMWFASINYIALLSHWRLVILAKGDCPAVDLPFTNPPGFGAPGSTYTACEHWHAFAQERIRQIHPDLVILTQYPNLGPGNVAYQPSVWQKSLTKEIRRLPVPATRVIVLGNIPQIATGGPDCLSRNPDNVQRCSSHDSPIISSMSDAEHRAAATTGAKYIDVVPMFCSTICTDVIGRYQPYWDQFHVTAAYSTVLGGFLAQSIDFARYATTSSSTTSAPASAASNDRAVLPGV